MSTKEYNDPLSFPVSPADVMERIAEYDSKAIQEILIKAEKEIREEAKDAIEYPERRDQLIHICESLNEILKPYNGFAKMQTPLHVRTWIHYIEVHVPDQTVLYGNEYISFINCLKEFSYCEWETLDETEIVIHLGFKGIYKG